MLGQSMAEIPGQYMVMLNICLPSLLCRIQRALLEIDIVMSSLLFMLSTYYSVVTDTNEHD